MSRGQLRPVMADDLDGLVRLLHGEEVRRYLCDDTVLPRETVAAMLARSEQLDSRGLGLWVIETTREGFAGVAGLQPVSAEAGAAPAMAGGIEPIIALDPNLWGQGLAGETLGILILYARGSLGLPRLVAAVDQPNARSHRLMQRCGFAATGRTPGPAHELVLYTLPLGDAEAPERCAWASTATRC